VDYGAEHPISVTQVPAGYLFSGWTVTGGTADIDDPTSVSTFVILTSGAATVRANFTIIQYALTVQTDGTVGATVTGSGTVNYGAANPINVTHIPTGYLFTGWTVTSGTATIASPSSASTTITLTSGAATVRANFTIIQYSLTVQTDGTAGATVTGSGTVDYGVARPISATAPTGYVFSGWTVTTGTATIANPSAASTTVTLTTGSATVRANFTIIQYVLTVQTDGTAGATVTGSGTVDYGAVHPISVTNVPAGHLFAGWTITSGTATIANPSAASTTVTLTSGAATVRANFTIIQYALTVQTDGTPGATVAGSGTVDYGAVHPISVTNLPDGYLFAGWTVTSGTATIANPSSASTTVTLTSGAATLRANFTIIQYALTVRTDGTTGATVTGSGTVNYGVAHPISATAPTGYVFSGWTVTSGTANIANPSSASTTVTLTGGAAIVQANFNIIQYALTIQTDGTAGATVTGSGTVDYGATNPISVTHIPTGYLFTGWTVTSGAADINDPASASTTVTLTGGAATVRANFTIIQYALTVRTDGTAGATATGSGTVNYGAENAISISNVPQGYAFQQWSLVSGNASIGNVNAINTTAILTSGDVIIQANFVKIVAVQNVTIPNGTMKIGDVVSATISVSYDANLPYNFVSGNIGGYLLTGFQRVNATTYLANFSITEGGNSYLAAQNIPVGNLVISNGTIQSAPYNVPIIQNNDLLDAEYPHISALSVESGTHAIGSTVVVNIRADGSGYSLLPASAINGIPVSASNVVFADLGGGNYRIRYMVMEGDNDVGPGELTISVTMAKPSGNIGTPYTLIANAENLTIDAHPPVVTRLEVTSRAYGVGQTIRMAIAADGTGYSAQAGTQINGIPLSSPRVTFIERGGGLYELSYTIGENDSNVAPGQLASVVVISDPAGNAGTPFNNIHPNSLEVYTELPSAVIAGTPEICEGEPAVLSVYFQGRTPWSFSMYNGSSVTNYNNIVSNQYSINVNPVQATTYTIPHVVDVNGVENAGTGAVSVKVNQKTFVEFVNIATGYSVEEDPVQLLANVPGGIFSGPGVISTSGIFDPAIADTIDSPHTIRYTYTNDNGCTSTASALVFVLGSMGGIYIPNEFVCDSDDPFTVNASNVAGEIGAFRLLNANGQAVAGLTDFGNNSAQIEPASLKIGSYTIEYRYFDGVVHFLHKEFLIETVEVPLIQNLTDESYCQNITPFILESNIENAAFEGPGVFATGQGFLFDPSGIVPGNITIYCENVSPHGCSEQTEAAVEVLEAPATQFTLSTNCIPPSGGEVAFDNLTPEKLNVESWLWDFGDPQSGENNVSNVVNPSHFYSESGSRTITLSATSQDGCAQSYEIETSIGTVPLADFTWISDCYSPGSGISFINRSTAGSEILNHFIWTFRDMDGNTLDQIQTASPADIVTFEFEQMGTYRVDLITETEMGCADSIVREITLQPTILLTDDGYREGFNDGEGFWKIMSDDGIASWVLSEPNFNGFHVIPGDEAWVTQFPAGTIGYRENSWIQSPCFDFSEVERGMIQLNIMRSFVPNLNGAVLQYREVLDEGWKTLGADAHGVDWYNVTNLINQPGGSQIGWGLEVFNPDVTWVRAAHGLDGLEGKTNVVLRVAIATTGAQGIGNQGFAFDEVYIGERTKTSVLEHFTNAATGLSRLADDLVDSISVAHSEDIIDIQYHMSYPGQDPMNQNNPLPAETRSVYYGIQEVPYALLDGGTSDEFRYGFSDLKGTPLIDYIDVATLEVPEFEISLDVDWKDSGLESSVSVTCLSDTFPGKLQLYLVVFEKEVTAYRTENGDTTFRNVVLDMLPNPAGKLLGGNWSKGDRVTEHENWSYQSYVEDIADLGVLAFIQNGETGKILQAEVKYRKWDVGTNSRKAYSSLVVYPNPAKNELYVNFGRMSEQEGVLHMVDMNGRAVLDERVPAGYQIQMLDIGYLDRGMYILYWLEGQQLRGLSKIVKTE
jgi:uncharacterized repeat protein (TIGR02543 family)